ncbi:hypothetical protein DL768_011335 [Monosporascus sp. mg162]|nr:hypothetical protein DL768_011335 [Monosporascus sp. mg162]
MANHGFLPRSGRNISTDDVVAGLRKGLNVAPDISIMASKNAIALNPEQPATTFDLDFLNRHNAIEHDNSLSRADAYFGDNHSFNQTVFDEFLSVADGQVISLDDAVAALASRIDTSRRTNPEFVFDLDGSTSTTASYLAIMGDSEKGEAVREWVKYLFENERLPTELGWAPRWPPYDMNALLSLSKRVETKLPSDLKDGHVTSFDMHASQAQIILG